MDNMLSSGKQGIGALSQTATKNQVYDGINGYYINFRFDANDGDISENPMAGHANGEDIHPYNISLLPLVAY